MHSRWNKVRFFARTENERPARIIVEQNACEWETLGRQVRIMVEPHALKCVGRTACRMPLKWERVRVKSETNARQVGETNGKLMGNKFGTTWETNARQGQIVVE